ncbi:hypothetical protein NUSPORA_00689 [Nucleospora cyclopteri]
MSLLLFFSNLLCTSNLVKVDSTTKEACFIFDKEEKSLKIRLYTWDRYVKFDEFNFLGVFMKNENLTKIEDVVMEMENTPYHLIVCYNNDSKQHLSNSINNAIETLKNSISGHIFIDKVLIENMLVEKPKYTKYFVELNYNLNDAVMKMFLNPDPPCTFTILYSTEGITSYCSGKIYRRDFLIESKKWFFNMENFVLFYIIITFPLTLRQNILKLVYNNKETSIK